MLYKFFYTMMLISYSYLSLSTPSLKMKMIGVLLTVVNGILFWR